MARPEVARGTPAGYGLSSDRILTQASIRQCTQRTSEFLSNLQVSMPVGAHDSIGRLRMGRVLAVLAVLTSCSAGPSSTQSFSAARSSCATTDGAFLLATSLPQAFVLDVDDRFVQSPLLNHRLPGSGPDPAAISNWQAARMRGWIAKIAVDGPDRPAEDAIARSLGYTVHTLPLVPLLGPVVQHNPGVLEIYRTNTAYSSAAGAADFMADLAGSARLEETTVFSDGGHIEPSAHALPLTGGDEAVAYEKPGFTGSQGAAETFFTFAVRLGRYVTQFTVQSGYGLNEQQAVAVLAKGVERAAHSCGLTPPVFKPM